MNTLTRLGMSTLFLVAAIPQARAQSTVGAPWDSIARILKTDAVSTGGYYRYNFPRRDLKLMVGDASVSPALALGAWAGFSGTPKEAAVMGDLVVTASEIKSVLAELERQGIAVTGIHNHLVGESPTITYVHFHAEGDALDLAVRIDRVIARTAAPRPVVAAQPEPVTIDTATIFHTLGSSGRARGAIAQLSFMLVKEPVTLDGREVTPALGYGSPVNIQLVGPNRAVATGDFAVLASRAGPTVSALTTHGITATAVHSHLIGERPTLSYIHFWADGALSDVLAGLKAALDAGK